MQILIADDHELARDALATLVRDRVPQADVRLAAAFSEVLTLGASGFRCDLALIDLHMPGIVDAHDLYVLRDALPGASVVVVSGDEQQEGVFAALASGARGYIFKSMSVNEISGAIERVLQGEIYLPPSIAMRRPEPAACAPAPQLPSELTGRQREVFEHLLSGKTTNDIAAALQIAEGTVKAHLASIYRTLGVRSRAEAIAKFK